MSRFLRTAERAFSPRARWRFGMFRQQVLLVLNLVFIQPYYIWKNGRAYLDSLLLRLGRYGSGAPHGGLWIHAPGMGEFLVADALVKALPKELPVVVTTFYSRGGKLDLARRIFKDRVTLTYLPLQFRFASRAFVRRFKPRALIHVEAKPWSLVCHELAGLEIPCAVVNAFIGERHLAVLKHRLIRPLLAKVQSFGVQSVEECRELIALGIEPERIVVTGSLKFNVREPEPRPELEARVAALAGGRPILVAGSVHVPEVEQVIAAFEGIGGGERALLVLAPRHPVWSQEMEPLVRARGHELVRRSALPDSGLPSVLLLDSEGELAVLYRLAAAAFVGGSLFKWGGHNPLEAARFGVPVAVGPSTEHLQAIAEPFDRAGAWCRVADGGELAGAWRRWLEDPEAGAELGRRGTELIAEHRGALEKTLAMLGPLLTRVASAEPAADPARSDEEVTLRPRRSMP